MEGSRATRVKQLADMLAAARLEAGKSQEWLAAELGVSRHSITNWESGISSPSFFMTAEWFRALGINPTKYFLQFFNPKEVKGIKASDSDEKIEKALYKLVGELPIEDKRRLLYILYGSHQSNPLGVLSMITADLHTPIQQRISIARTIIDNYEIAEQRGELIETDHIMPNLDLVKECVEKAKVAAIKGIKGYNIIL